MRYSRLNLTLISLLMLQSIPVNGTMGGYDDFVVQLDTTQLEYENFYSKEINYDELQRIVSDYEDDQRQAEIELAFRRSIAPAWHSEYESEQPHSFELTAYTLSPEENGFHGTISAAQYELAGEFLPTRYIAVDPKVIPYHSKVYIEFPEEKRYIEFHGEMIDLNGEYTAVDCGSAIKQNRIDLFVGGDGHYYDKVANGIGRQQVAVYFPVERGETND